MEKQTAITLWCQLNDWQWPEALGDEPEWSDPLDKKKRIEKEKSTLQEAHKLTREELLKAYQSGEHRSRSNDSKGSAAAKTD